MDLLPGEGQGGGIALVGEGPGANEEESGRNFAGRAGEILNDCLRDAGLPRSSLWICNAIRHRATTALGKNRKPTLHELDCCRGYLVDELARVQPRVIVALGDSALTTLIGKALGGITAHRLRTVWSDEFNAWIIATNHPAYVLRHYDERHWIVKAFEIAQRILVDGAPAPSTGTTVDVIRSVEQARAMRDTILNSPRVHYDWESTGVHLTHALGFCVSFAIRPGHAFVVPRFLQGWSPAWLRAELREIDAILTEIFISDVKKGGFHIAFDNTITRTTLGVWPNAIAFCGMQAHHMLNNHLGTAAHGLKTCADLYTDMGRYDDGLDAWLIANGHTAQGRADHGAIWLAPDDLVHDYNGKDSDASIRLEDVFVPKLHEAGLWHAFTHERMPLVVEHQEIDRHGLRLNEPYLNRISRELTTSLDDLDARLNAIAGTFRPPGWKHGAEPINPGSHQQVAWLLFDHLGLPIVARTETGQPSTKEDALIQLRDMHDAVPLVMRRRAFEKIKGTYVDGTGKSALTQKKALRAVLDDDGYARMNTFLHGTVTHRFVTRKPFSPHTFPKTVPGMPSVRRIIIPDDGYSFVMSDYSQQEFAIQAIEAGQWDLADRMLNDGEDVHEIVAHDLYGKTKRDYQNADGTWRSKDAEDEYRLFRGHAKSTGFMILYLGGARKLARMALGCTYDYREQRACKFADSSGACGCESTAHDYIQSYYERYPAIRDWQYARIKEARRTGRVTEPFGTYRILDAINDRDKFTRLEAEREAVNFPIQRGGSGVMVRALLRTQARFRGKPPLRAAFPGYATVSRTRCVFPITANGRVTREPIGSSEPLGESLAPFAPMAAHNPHRANDRDADWEFPGRVIVTIHDQLISQVRSDLVDEGLYIQRACMEAPYPELDGRSLRTDSKISKWWE